VRLKIPNLSLVTFSVHLRVHLLADAPFVTTFAKSFLRFNSDRFSLKVLPVASASRPWPLALVTLKHRTLGPVVERFIEFVRRVRKIVNRSDSAAKIRPDTEIFGGEV
jgi:hypothetical protein